jgi:hypothetical protein
MVSQLVCNGAHHQSLIGDKSLFPFHLKNKEITFTLKIGNRFVGISFYRGNGIFGLTLLFTMRQLLQLKTYYQLNTLKVNYLGW